MSVKHLIAIHPNIVHGHFTKERKIVVALEKKSEHHQSKLDSSSINVLHFIAIHAKVVETFQSEVDQLTHISIPSAHCYFTGVSVVIKVGVSDYYWYLLFFFLECCKVVIELVKLCL